jgi:hypothetical protein
VGKSIYRFLNELPGAHAIRSRLDRVAALIDRVAMENTSASILAVGCGHLREADRSSALQHRLVGRFLAIDQDPRSLTVVSNRYAELGISTLQCSVVELLKGQNNFGKFHLIYAVGLYDYLAQGAACRLTEVLFDHLHPNGEIFVVNGLPGVPSSAYMETYMDWHIVYRTAEQLEATADGVPCDLIQGKEVFTDQENIFAFLWIKRSGKAIA